MNGYIERLEKLGYSHPDAYYTVDDMMREVGEDGLKDYIEGLEEYVRLLQPVACRSKSGRLFC